MKTKSISTDPKKTPCPLTVHERSAIRFAIDLLRAVQSSAHEQVASDAAFEEIWKSREALQALLDRTGAHFRAVKLDVSK